MKAEMAARLMAAGAATVYDVDADW
jgi:hypothetical protein